MELLRRKLKNGINVIMERRELPIVAVSVTNNYGAGFEDSDIKGIAHFIEHLVFTGTKKRSHEDISREIEKRGGVLNAFTTNEITSFWFKLPNEHIISGLEIIKDILKNASFDKEKFEKEKKVILEEIKMHHDDPSRHVFDMICENLYEKPFSESILGNKETIGGFKRDFVYDCFKKHYSGNYTVVIVGNTDFEKVCDFFENNFDKGLRVEKKLTIKKRNLRSVEERAGIDQAHYVFGMHAPLFGTKEYYALEVLDAYLANGMSSRLFLKIREEKGLAYSVSSSLFSEKNYSYYTIYVGTVKEALGEVENIILNEFNNIENISEKELKESKERLIGLRKIGSEESVRVMEELVFNEFCLDAEEYYKHEERINSISLKEVKDMAKKMIKSYSSAAIVPK